MQGSSKKIYFLSDFHLGAPNYESSLQREKKIVSFLNSIESTAAEIFILGDAFDFWFEYKTTVPKGYTRLLGKLAQLTDNGIRIHFFVGNHDLWMKDYFSKELGVKVYHHPQTFNFFGQKVYVAHGDGLGPGDNGYKFLKKIFTNKICRWLFAALHPTWGMGIANYFSRKSRAKNGGADEKFLGEENEWLVIHSKQILQQEHFDFFVYGHRHLPLKILLSNNSTYINLGDWITHFTYAELSEEDFDVKKYENAD